MNSSGPQESSVPVYTCQEEQMTPKEVSEWRSIAMAALYVVNERVDCCFHMFSNLLGNINEKPRRHAKAINKVVARLKQNKHLGVHFSICKSLNTKWKIIAFADSSLTHQLSFDLPAPPSKAKKPIGSYIIMAVHEDWNPLVHGDMNNVWYPLCCVLDWAIWSCLEALGRLSYSAEIKVLVKVKNKLLAVNRDFQLSLGIEKCPEIISDSDSSIRRLINDKGALIKDSQVTGELGNLLNSFAMGEYKIMFWI